MPESDSDSDDFRWDKQFWPRFLRNFVRASFLPWIGLALIAIYLGRLIKIRSDHPILWGAIFAMLFFAGKGAGQPLDQIHSNPVRLKHIDFPSEGEVRDCFRAFNASVPKDLSGVTLYLIDTGCEISTTKIWPGDGELGVSRYKNIIVGNSQLVPVKGSGALEGSVLTCSEKFVPFTLSPLLYAPGISQNLWGPSSALWSGANIILLGVSDSVPEPVCFIELEGEFIPTVRKGNLFFLPVYTKSTGSPECSVARPSMPKGKYVHFSDGDCRGDSFSPAFTAKPSGKSVKVPLLPQTERELLAKRVHTRMGCLGLGTLKDHARSKSDIWERCGFSASERRAILETHSPIPCVACGQSKSGAVTNKKLSQAAYSGYLVAIAGDTSGPLPPTPSRGLIKGGFDRFVVLVCKGTGMRHVYLLRSKRSDEVLSHLRSLIALADKQGHSGTREVTTDGGKEFVVKSFTRWLKKKGIEFRVSAPYQHWQNGYPES